MRDEPLWRCADCGREFANRNQSHACGTHELEAHFRGKPEEIRRLFDCVVAVIQAIGPVRVLPEKTRIAFRLVREADIDEEFRAWMAEAYRVGNQEHLIARHR